LYINIRFVPDREHSVLPFEGPISEFYTGKIRLFFFFVSYETRNYKGIRYLLTYLHTEFWT